MKLRVKALLTHLACLAAVVAASPVLAQDPSTCRAVHFADIGWTDITSTTALASTVFEGLGYQPVTTVASVPISFAGLRSKQARRVARLLVARAGESDCTVHRFEVDPGAATA